MAFRLRIAEGKGAGKEFVFRQPRVTIGRLPDNDLVLYDTGVSRYHCEVIEEADGVTLRDTGSSNGTLLNEVVTTEARIKPGDKIGIGPVTFVFALDDAARGAAKDRDPEGPRDHAEAFAPGDKRRRHEMEEGNTQAHSVAELLESGDTRPDKDAVAPAMIRTPTGSFMAYRARVRRSWRFLPPKTRRVILLGGGVVMLAAMAAVSLIIRGNQTDRSSEIFPLTPDSSATRYGFGKVDVTTRDRVNFSFEYKGGRASVGYAIGGTDSDNEVAISVNGQPVGHAPRSASWTRGLELVLPRRLLARGPNILTFDNTSFPPREERWGVHQVQVHETTLRPADPVKARELYDLGRAAYDTRSVTPENLQRSIKYFREAAMYLEAMEPAPDMLASIEEAEKRSAKELDGIIDGHLFAAERAVRFGQREQAIESLRDLLRYVPDPEDRRHKEIQDRLANIGGKGALE